MAVDPLALRSIIDSSQANATEVNDYPYLPCTGVTLADLRRRLRNELSGYSEGTLISNDPTNDVEMQFINDGISQLFPHDWQVVSYAIKTNPDPNNPQARPNRFFLPDDCEHVLTVHSATQDINNDTVMLSPLPHGEAWTFDRSFYDAISTNLVDGTPWIDQPKKAVWLSRYWQQKPWLVARYARKWPPLKGENDCLDPSPNRVSAIVYYAASEYFLSQFQVNTESIRYRNYQALANSFRTLFQQQLVRDSKPLYIL